MANKYLEKIAGMPEAAFSKFLPNYKQFGGFSKTIDHAFLDKDEIAEHAKSLLQHPTGAGMTLKNAKRVVTGDVSNARGQLAHTAALGVGGVVAAKSLTNNN